MVQISMLAAAAAAMAGCGSVGFSVSGGEQTSATAATGLTSGNWYITSTSNVNGNGTGGFGGYLNASGNTLTLTTTPGQVCIPAYSPVNFTGALNGSSITLAAPPIGSGKGVMTIAGTARYGTNIEGTYSFPGAVSTDRCYGDTGTVSGVLVPALDGTWSGSFVENAYDQYGNPIYDEFNVPLTNTVNIAAVIKQSTTPKIMSSPALGTVDAMPISGTFTFGGDLTSILGIELSGILPDGTFPFSPCYTTGTIDSTQSFVVGRSFQMYIKTDTGGTLQITGSLDPTRASSLSISYTVQSGVCNYYQVKGSMLNQTTILEQQLKAAQQQ